MSWQSEVDEIEERKLLAQKMGGEAGIAVQHQRGKLTVRERIEHLIDPDSFREFGGMVGVAEYDDHNQLKGFTPRVAVEGTCLLDGRKVVLTGGDFTVRGGSAGGSGGLGSELPANSRALEWRMPYVRLLDAAGSSRFTISGR